MKHPDYFTQQERDILENYFVTKKANCKQDFKHLLLDKLATYGHAPESLNSAPIELSERTAHQWISDFSHVLWDEDSGNNLVTHIFSQPKFEITNTRVKDLKKLSPNWNHINHDGQNVLHIMAKMKRSGNYQNFIEEQNLDTEVIDNEGKYFTWYLLNRSYTFKTTYFGFLSDIDNIEQSIKLFNNYNEHFKNLSLTDIEILSAQIEKNKQEISQHVEKMLKNAETARQFKSLIGHEIINEILILYQPLEATLMYVKLQNDLSNKPNPKTRKI